MPAGRPTDLTPEAIADVARLLPTALYLWTVADYIGVHRSTVYRWLKRGRREETRLRNPRAKRKPSEAIYLQFRNAHKKGLAEGEIYATQIIRKAAAGHWQAAAWLLERRYPARWGRDRSILAELVKQVKELQLGRAAAARRENARDVLDDLHDQQKGLPRFADHVREVRQELEALAAEPDEDDDAAEKIA